MGYTLKNINLVLYNVNVIKSDFSEKDLNICVEKFPIIFPDLFQKDPVIFIVYSLN